MLKNICAGRVFQNAMVSRKLRRKRKLRQNPGLTILNKNIHSTQLGSSMVDYLPIPNMLTDAIDESSLEIFYINTLLHKDLI